MTAAQHRVRVTRVEVIVAIAVLAVAGGLLIPAALNARESARRSQCRNNLKQVGLALHNYHDTHQVLPFASTYGLPAGSNAQHTWIEFTAPFIDSSPFYSRLNFHLPNNTGEPSANRRTILAFNAPIYRCPSNPYAESHRCRDGTFFDGWDAPVQGLCYPLNAGSILPDGPTPDCPAIGSLPCITETTVTWDTAHSHPHPGPFSRGVTSTRLTDFANGGAFTFLAGERNPEALRFGGAFSANFPVAFTAQRPNSLTRNASNVADYRANGGYSSHHDRGLHMLMADGAVRFVSNEVDHSLFCRLGDLAKSAPQVEP